MTDDMTSKQRLVTLSKTVRHFAEIHIDKRSDETVAELFEAADYLQNQARTPDETAVRRCGWFGEGRGQCLLKEGHETHPQTKHHTCEQDGRLLDVYPDICPACARPVRLLNPSANDVVRWICPVCSTVNDNRDERCCVGTCKGVRPNPWPPQAVKLIDWNVRATAGEAVDALASVAEIVRHIDLLLESGDEVASLTPDEWRRIKGAIGAIETPDKPSDVKRDEKLRQVSLATMDAKLLGCGFVMILPDNSFRHVPLERIQIKPESSSVSQAK